LIRILSNLKTELRKARRLVLSYSYCLNWS